MIQRGVEAPAVKPGFFSSAQPSRIDFSGSFDVTGTGLGFSTDSIKSLNISTIVPTNHNQTFHLFGDLHRPLVANQCGITDSVKPLASFAFSKLSAAISLKRLKDWAVGAMIPSFSYGIKRSLFLLVYFILGSLPLLPTVTIFITQCTPFSHR